MKREEFIDNLHSYKHDMLFHANNNKGKQWIMNMDKKNHAKRKLKKDPKMNPPESTEQHINNLLDRILNGKKDKDEVSN